MNKVYEAEVVDPPLLSEELDPLLSDQKREELKSKIDTCSVCKKKFGFGLVVIMGSPICGGCFVRGARDLGRLASAAWDALTKTEKESK